MPCTNGTHQDCYETQNQSLIQMQSWRNQRKDNLIDLAKCSFNSMMKCMKIHMVLNYTIDNNNVSSAYIDSIYDEVIE